LLNLNFSARPNPNVIDNVVNIVKITIISILKISKKLIINKFTVFDEIKS
jgi:hypothetical protein